VTSAVRVSALTAPRKPRLPNLVAKFRKILLELERYC
jgi:hypothetical protein